MTDTSTKHAEKAAQAHQGGRCRRICDADPGYPCRRSPNDRPQDLYQLVNRASSRRQRLNTSRR